MKSDYSKESITEFLSRKYGEDIRLFPIKEGQESQAYWFSRGGREYVVRINSNMEGFKKDKYAYEHFRSDRVPIPEVVETGNFDGTHYFCISVKADGITYEDSDEETVVRLLGDITDVTEAISRTDISGTSGCGVFDSDTGNAPFYSWREYLAEVFERDWTAVSRSYVNLSLIDELLAAYRELISYCPEERALFHGDFGSNNVIVGKKSRISGVIDWDCAAYGDFLYDIATAYFWRTWLMCMEKTAAYWERKYSHLPRYTERILCYELRIGLTEIYENAVENDTETTEWLQNRCREILREYRQRKKSERRTRDGGFHIPAAVL
ncbi:phosphotransferase [Enteroscipio rubneri]